MVYEGLPEHRAEFRVQTVNHIVLGKQLLVRAQEGICYKLVDGGTTKNSEISVLPCVLFSSFPSRTWSCISPLHRT